MIETTYKGMPAIGIILHGSKRQHRLVASWLYRRSYLYAFEGNRLFVPITKWGVELTRKAVQAAIDSTAGA